MAPLTRTFSASVSWRAHAVMNTWVGASPASFSSRSPRENRSAATCSTPSTVGGRRDRPEVRQPEAIRRSARAPPVIPVAPTTRAWAPGGGVRTGTGARSGRISGVDMSTTVRMPVAMLPIVADDELTPRLAEVLRSSRLSRGLSTAALAEGSGVSRASIVKLERAESQPSAALLGRLCPPLGLTLSELFARVERPREDSGRLLRAGQAPVWTDPASGYRRVSRSPLAGGPLQLTEIELPRAPRSPIPPTPTATSTSRSGSWPVTWNSWRTGGATNSAPATASNWGRPPTARSPTTATARPGTWWPWPAADATHESPGRTAGALAVS